MHSNTTGASTGTAEILAFDGQSDERLIKAIASGNRSAMRTLYLRHNARVFRFISRLVADRALAEDLVSDVFIDVWSKAGSYEGRSQVSTWLLAIARFKALSAINRHREVLGDEPAMELVEDTADTPEETVLKEDRTAQLRRCLAQMSREHREVIDLVYYHEKSVEEVAQITRLPKNTVKTRMFYARKRLAQLLASHQDFGYLAAPQAA
jgi:RNA polymerase sigma-70 factor (ECF subfamily)